MTVAPDKIKDIQILETIKEGKNLFLKNKHRYKTNLFDLTAKTAIVTAGGLLYFAVPISECTSGQVFFVNAGGIRL